MFGFRVILVRGMPYNSGKYSFFCWMCKKCTSFETIRAFKIQFDSIGLANIRLKV